MKQNKMKRYCLFFFLIINLQGIAQQANNKMVKIPPMPNGAIWKDTKGNTINAHGGGLLLHNGIYYWFGEIKKGKTWLVPDQQWEDYRVPAGGISCYSSKDLNKWRYEGVALPSVMGNPNHDLDTSKVIERPKVIYNKRTKKFVMWMHVDANDYSYSQAGVAVSDTPTGPYKYLGSVKPNGQMSRDMTLYKDNDERAYLIYASESNKTMQVCLLNNDYLSPTTTYTRITSAQNREAPAIFKYNKKYYLITSDCTGWSPNPATYATADSLLGEWKQMGNPCQGPDAETTFISQSTFVLPLPGQKNVFLFMADRWNKTDLPDSRYIWLPIKMVSDKPVIEWVN
jgi:Glycosyl hydrolases family 43